MAKTLLTVNGAYRNVKDGFITVDGVYRRVKAAYMTVNGVYRPCWSSYDPVFANNTWEQIAEACSTRQVPDTWVVGDQKTMTIDSTSYSVAIIGKSHDYYSDESGKAPLTFQLVGAYQSTGQMNGHNTNTGGWENCKMRSEKLPTILSHLPTEVQNSIKEIKKRTGTASGTTTVVSNDKLFLLSEKEVFNTTNQSVDNEGTQYEYYKTAKNRIKTCDGSTQRWWLRSPRKSSSAEFCYVTPEGLLAYSIADNPWYISFAFCF